MAAAGKAWVLRSVNGEVTDYYLDIVASSLERLGIEVTAIAASDGVDALASRAATSDVIVVPSAMAFRDVTRRGFSNLVFWSQGVVPEESYLRRHSRMRKWVLSGIERDALRRARFCLFVSDAMRKHYESKYRLSFEGRHYVMPCSNAILRPDLFSGSGRYERARFAYVGSLATWQCFDETVGFFAKLQARIPYATLKVLTFQQDEARRALERSGVSNWTVGCVPPDEVADALSDVGFGFVLRQDNVVNRVSTPTKLSSYMASGVIPVFSSCIEGFGEASRGMRYVCPVVSFKDVDSVADYLSGMFDPTEIKEEFTALFDGYYSRERHVANLAASLGSCLVAQ